MPLQERRGERSRTICSCNQMDNCRDTYLNSQILSHRRGRIASAPLRWEFFGHGRMQYAPDQRIQSFIFEIRK